MKKVFELFTRMYDFRGGSSCSKQELEQFRTEVAERLANSPDKKYTSIATGNMFTIAVRSYDEQIEVIQCEGYKQHRYRVETA